MNFSLHNCGSDEGDEDNDDGDDVDGDGDDDDGGVVDNADDGDADAAAGGWLLIDAC